MFAKTPDPPYYAVIFASQTTAGENGYGTMAEHMFKLDAEQPGYLGVESVRNADGFGITVSYWSSLEALANWKRNSEHRAAQEQGRSQWYEHYEIRVSKVERAYAKSGRSGTSIKDWSGDMSNKF
jgi:heme-degrading monooxygenase HmoA